MDIKEKVKEIKEKHPELKGDVSRILWLTIGCGAGYIVGSKWCEYRFGLALERINSVDPEIFPKIQKSIEVLKDK